MNDRCRKIIENFKGKKIIHTERLSGGCINNAMMVIYDDDSSDLLKVNEHAPPEMFRKEENGLKELAKSGAVRVPNVHLSGDDFILTEYIRPHHESKTFFDDFGRSFARLHKFNSDKFGFFEDNYIGSTVQVNSFMDNWKDFFVENRILFQFRLAEKNGYSDEKLRKGIDLILNKADDILGSVREPPSLLHGDLWSGNFMRDENGNACLIDPAVYYGHREADLAMTKLFGGFESRFYESYNEEYPLSDGYLYRENIYKLYQILNHVNLFGRGYYPQVLSLINYYK